MVANLVVKILHFQHSIYAMSKFELCLPTKKMFENNLFMNKKKNMKKDDENQRSLNSVHVSRHSTYTGIKALHTYVAGVKV